MVIMGILFGLAGLWAIIGAVLNLDSLMLGYGAARTTGFFGRNGGRVVFLTGGLALLAVGIGMMFSK